jgi:hypothetical protein
LVWRGAGARSHAPGRCTAGASDKPDHSDQPHDSDEPDQPNEPLEAGDFCDDADDHHSPFERSHTDHEYNDDDSKRNTVTASTHAG